MPNDGRAAMDVAFSISTVDVSSRGRWVEAPALKLDGQTVVANGDWIKIAYLYDEDWIAEAMHDPKL